MVGVLSLGATVAWAGVAWCLFVAVCLVAASVKADHARRSRRTRTVRARELAWGWALVLLSYAVAIGTGWAIWQLGHGRWSL